MFAGLLWKHQNAGDNYPRKDGRGERTAYVQATLSQRFVKEIADRRTLWASENKGDPKQLKRLPYCMEATSELTGPPSSCWILS